MRVLIIGCGYVGVSLGAELVRRGHEVGGVRRSNQSAAELRAAGIEPLMADLGNRESLNRLPTGWDWVVNAASSTGGGVADYREVYRNGTRHLLEWLDRSRVKKYVYTSSTGVYGQNDGSEVTEDSPTMPETETAKILVETESILFDAVRSQGFPAVVLRVAGIYGPHRGHLFRQFLRGEARITGPGLRVLNMIHREDLSGVIVTALENGSPGAVYNAVDDEPVCEIDFFRWLAERLGRSLPPSSAEEIPGPSKRRATNKTVRNRKLKADLGYVFKYPTFREGYEAEIRGVQALGGMPS